MKLNFLSVAFRSFLIVVVIFVTAEEETEEEEERRARSLLATKRSNGVLRAHMHRWLHRSGPMGQQISDVR